MELYKIAAVIALIVMSALPGQRPVRRDLLVAAAASLGGVSPALTQAFHEETGIDLRFNFAGSNTLARQIIEGARVDVFISADEAQMDAVEKAGRLVAGSRVDVVSNQLVLITGAASSPRVVGADDLAGAAVRRVAMGDPGAVPAGVYGRQWLENLRLWSAVQSKIIPLPSSPAVVAAVSEGRANAGIVYASDVTNRRGIHVAVRAALEDAPRIVYPAAAITGGRVPLAQAFIDFLQRARAQQIFATAGFRPLGPR